MGAARFAGVRDRADGRIDEMRDRTSPDRVRAYILLVFALAAAWALLLMLRPFLPAIVTSATLAVLVFPAYRWFRGHLRHRETAAFLVTIVVFFLVLLPATGLALLLLDQIRAGLQWMAEGAVQVLEPAGLLALLIERVTDLIGVDRARFAAALSGQSENLVRILAERTLGLFTGLGGWFLQAGVALFTLYYLLRDGETLVAHLKWLLPLDPELSDRLFRQADEVTHATIFGNVVVAVVQGTLGGVAFWVAGIDSPVVWATLMGVLSLLPVVGAFIVWVPAGIALVATGHAAAGILLLAFGVLVISTVDNVLRALLVGGRAQLHPLIVFFSVLGGLVLFGAVGVFVGPVLFVVSLTLIEMARVSLDPRPTAALPE